jgi:uncharacterized protein YjdB
MRNRRSIVGMVLLTLCCACSGGGTGPGNVTGPVASIAVDAASTTSVFIGSTISMVASAHNSSGVSIAGQTFTWTSANPLVATVSPAGVVTGVERSSLCIGGGAGSEYALVAFNSSLDTSNTVQTVSLVATGTVPVANGRLRS